MADVAAQDVREIAAKLSQIRTRSDSRRDMAGTTATHVDDLVESALEQVPHAASGDLDDAAWNALAPEERSARYLALIRLYDSVAVLAEVDGPSDPKSIMYRDYVSNRGVILLSSFAFLGTLLLLIVIHANWARATTYQSKKNQVVTATPGGTGAGVTAGSATSGAEQGPAEQDVLLMVTLMGALGGFVHLTSSLAKYIGNRQLVRSWIVYYLLMPLEGSALAVTVYLMLRVGVLNPAATGGTATQNLNWVGIYALSTLAGLFSKQALEMLSDVFNTIFRRVQAKDAGGTGRPSDTDQSPPRP